VESEFRRCVFRFLCEYKFAFGLVDLVLFTSFASVLEVFFYRQRRVWRNLFLGERGLSVVYDLFALGLETINDAGPETGRDFMSEGLVDT